MRQDRADHKPQRCDGVIHVRHIGYSYGKGMLAAAPWQKQVEPLKNPGFPVY